MKKNLFSLTFIERKMVMERINADNEAAIPLTEPRRKENAKTTF
jgi:hypothetical protein